MILCSALPVREVFAAAVLRGSQNETQSELISLAWTLRNRAEQARQEIGDFSRDLDVGEARALCRALLADLGVDAAPNGSGTGGNGHAATGQGGWTFQQALACVSLVCDGLVPDPTNGATRAHAHDREPEWARRCEATALIGALLFFRAEPDVPERAQPARAYANDG